MKRLRGMLGLCMRSGRLASGEENCVESIRRGKVRLALLDAGIANNSRKELEFACKKGNVPLRYIPDGILGDSIGKPGRMAAVVLDKGFADRILEIIEELGPNSGVQ